MRSFSLRVLLAGGMIAGVAAAPARAQFRMGSYPPSNTYGVGITAAALAGSPLNAAPFTFNPAASPFRAGHGYPPDNGPFTFGVLYPQAGVADGYDPTAVFGAFGPYPSAEQHARALHEQLRQERAASNQQAVEQRRWENSHLPTTEDDRERARQSALRHCQAGPPATEIVAGDSLNVLLGDAERLQALGVTGEDAALDNIDLAHINLVPLGGGAANAGLLRDVQSGGGLTWPVALRDAAFQKQRDRVNDLLRDAVRQASVSGRVDAAGVQGLLRVCEQMSDQLRRSLVRNDLPPHLYIPAKKFLADLSAAARALGAPDATNYFNGKHAAQGRTVADLVRDMRTKGLRFAPATTYGQQAAYVALHRVLAAYDVSLNANVLPTAAR